MTSAISVKRAEGYYVLGMEKAGGKGLGVRLKVRSIKLCQGIPYLHLYEAFFPGGQIR